MPEEMVKDFIAVVEARSDLNLSDSMINIESVEHINELSILSWEKPEHQAITDRSLSGYLLHGIEVVCDDQEFALCKEVWLLIRTKNVLNAKFFGLYC